MPILYKNNAPATGQDSLYASATTDKNTGELIIKIVNALGKEQITEVKLEGKNTPAIKAHLTVLKNNDLEAVNSLSKPYVVAPTEQTLEVKGKTVALTLAPYSVSVIKVKIQ